MGLLNWISGGYLADDERCADLVRQYLIGHQIAVVLLDHVAEVDADAILDAALGRQAGVALNHAILNLDGAAHGLHHTAEFGQHAVAGALDDATVVDRDRRVDQVAAKRTQARQGAVLVRFGQPAEADDVGGQDRGQFPGLAHGAIAEGGRSPVAVA